MQAELGFDGTPLSRLARQVPKPKPCGNKNLDNQRQADYAKEIEIIDRMQKNRVIISPLHGLLLSNDLEGIAEAHNVDQDWSGKYQQLCRLPTWFMCQWLIDYAQEERVSAVINKDLLCALEVKSHENLVMLMQWVLQLLATQALPSEFSNQEVCALGLSMRANEVGSRLAALVQAGAFASKGDIDWSCAADRPVWHNSYVTALVHPVTGTQVQLPPHVYICSAYELVDNHLDHMARCVLQGSTHTLGDYFTGDDADEIGKEFWVNHTKQFKRLGEHAKAAKAQLSAPAPARGPAEKKR